MIAATHCPVAERARIQVARTPLLLMALLVLLVVGMIPAGMVGTAEAQCDRTDRYGNPEWGCTRSAPTWVEYARQGAGGRIFEWSSANQVFMISVSLAALIIPAGIGLLAHRVRWIALAGLVAECSVPFGFALGAGRARFFWPDVPADGDYAVLGLIFAPFFALGLALPFVLVSATVGYVVKRRYDFKQPAGWLTLGIVLAFELMTLSRMIDKLGLGIYP